MSTATIGEHEFFYEEQGSGPPLLLIMGLGADSAAWLFQVPEFARHYRTITFDNRGVGRSAKPPGPYTIAGMADDAAGLLEILGVERAHVVGVSMGGMIAQELALRHPERVHGLVLACTFPEPDDDANQRRQASLTQLGGSVDANGETRLDLNAIDPFMVLQKMLPMVFTPAFIQSDLPKIIQLFSGSLQWGFSMDALLCQLGAAMGHRTTDRLHQVTAPTLVITGDADQLVSPANSDILARTIPDARLVKVPGGSHGFNFETPDIFNREVLSFLATVPA